ncbi:EF-hand domain-containing protein 1 [Trichonephila clavata]|uniref:EF-hand domain-containing protein 1 n=1 Tax=Trichonephila clavata TaxID=2740835 RepID=A0A8X6KPT5_TRICU|nr:EF-hand domain-containing protein 1 [Trichonephila clavata]
MLASKSLQNNLFYNQEYISFIFVAQKTHFGYPTTLVYSKGVPVPQPIFSTSTKNALHLLDVQNKILDSEKAAELTYGPKRSAPKAVELPRYLALDKKVLRFSGFIREDVHDYSREEYRIRPVKVLYYLQDDTMEVIEPKIPNSGLVQGQRSYISLERFEPANGRIGLQHNYPHHGLRSMDKGKQFLDLRDICHTIIVSVAKL